MEVNQKKKKLIFVAVVIAVIVAIAVGYMRSSSGKLMQAKISASSGNYEKAFNILNEASFSASTPKLESYKQLYLALNRADEVRSENYFLSDPPYAEDAMNIFENRLDEFTDKIESISSLIESIDSVFLSDSENEKCTALNEAVEKSTEYIADLEPIATALEAYESLDELEENTFRKGNWFVPNTVIKDVEQWKTEINSGNEVYKNFVGEDLDGYNSAILNCDDVINDMKDNENKNSRYHYTKYSGDYFVNPYSDEESETSYNMAKKISAAWYKNMVIHFDNAL